jgi:acid stress-induced BolA-like protein IbaG/YrbA
MSAYKIRVIDWYMNESEIKELIESAIKCESVEVAGDGSHFEAIVISKEFEGKRPVARQQMVYAVVQDRISSGELHALSLKTKTPSEL